MNQWWPITIKLSLTKSLFEMVGGPECRALNPIQNAYLREACPPLSQCYTGSPCWHSEGDFEVLPTTKAKPPDAGVFGTVEGTPYQCLIIINGCPGLTIVNKLLLGHLHRGYTLGHGLCGPRAFILLQKNLVLNYPGYVAHAYSTNSKNVLVSRQLLHPSPCSQPPLHW